MLWDVSLKDSAKWFDRYNTMILFKLRIGPREDPPSLPPHWRQAFPI